MKKAVSKWVVLATMAAGLGMASGAHAAWTFGAGSTVAADATGIAISTITGAYAANGGALSTSGAVIYTSLTYGINNFAAGATWAVDANSTLALYAGGGLGMSSDSLGGTAPNHALDNGPSTTKDANNFVNGLGNTEAVLLGFTGSTILNSINLGYVAGDADISVFRFQNTVSLGIGGAPAFAGTGATLAQMQTAGWELVGNYGDLVQGVTKTINTGNVGSSWWLVSAYNSSYGAATSGVVNQGNDYFKLFSTAGAACVGISATCANNPPPPGVPEPASLALVAIAGLGAVGARRRKSKVAA